MANQKFSLLAGSLALEDRPYLLQIANLIKNIFVNFDGYIGYKLTTLGRASEEDVPSFLICTQQHGIILIDVVEEKVLNAIEKGNIEYWEIENLPEIEREEIADIYREKGFKGELLNKIVDHICSDKDLWVAEMMKDELGMMRDSKSPFKIGLATLISFVLVGLIPLLVYLWDFFFPSEINTFLWTSILTGLAFLIVGWLKGIVNQTSALRSILETVGLGLLAAVVAFYVGDILEQFFK